MISFDTFSGAGDDRAPAHSPLFGEPLPLPLPLPAAPAAAPADEETAPHFECYPQDATDYETGDEEEDHVPPRSTAAAASSSAAASPPSSGRVQSLFQLLSLKNHAGDARQALVHRLLGVSNVKELLLSRATQEQIASAANDAITDEILATVDLEDQRRQSITAAPMALPMASASASADAAPARESEHATAELAVVPVADDALSATQLSTLRVLELVDVLDSTTGGMVRRILVNVRRRTPVTLATARGDKATEFCDLCDEYRGHSTAQHRCRRCGALGQHRSQVCPRAAAAAAGKASSARQRRKSSRSSPTASTDGGATDAAPSSTASRLTPDAADQSFCTFCGTWGFHSTERHRCRICGVVGEHRSRHCPSRDAARSRWRGSPVGDDVPAPVERQFCELCNAARGHRTAEHRCRICLKVGEHRSKQCPLHTPTPPAQHPPQAAAQAPARTETARSPPSSSGKAFFCSFCGKDAAHASAEHICRNCRATGLHRSGDCPTRPTSAVLSYSVQTASKVRTRVLESLPLVLPASASTLVLDSLDKVGDVDVILRRSLQRLGVWGGGSQTPITTPYAPPVARSAAPSAAFPAAAAPAGLGLQQGVDGAGVYVLSYAEGRSVVPERILQYMRLLMHHEVSTNAFSVVVRFDARPSQWELQRPGMVTPHSLPSSPTMSEQLKKRMAKYTLQTLLGARDKLVKQVVAQRKLQQQQQQLQLHALSMVMPPQHQQPQQQQQQQHCAVGRGG
ncbi:hypothetical protein P43SY_004809 [Pythium insidiosum]|uniref:CCHC-type domain-containing protein n=1 Tax=Pythium insidiosum TaxID=114742 RepID=A0AAD5M329_PYTIN|nr:hypothetical protein P43SY_004809 [Pythium insidiosum]